PFTYNGTFLADNTLAPAGTPSPTPAPSPSASPSSGGSAPRYYNYAPPTAVGENAGEPTVGFNPISKRAMYIAGLQTLRVTFPENIAPANSLPNAAPAKWEDVSYILTKTKSLDPIIFTDQRYG